MLTVIIQLFGSPMSPPPQASVSPGSYALSKCFLPEESTVIGVYCSAGACLLLLFLAHCLWMKGLLQCLSLCLLGKHKSLWTTLPRAHRVLGPSHWVRRDVWGFANVTLLLWTGQKSVHTALMCLSKCFTALWRTRIYILNVFKGHKVWWWWCGYSLWWQEMCAKSPVFVLPFLEVQVELMESWKWSIRKFLITDK